MKKSAAILSAALLVSGLPCAAYASSQGAGMPDTQSTVVRYTVPAKITLLNGDVEIVLEVEVGQTLQAPAAADKPGYTFVGWADEASGELWDFSKPVTSHMTLVAQYKQDDGAAAPGDNPAGGSGDASGPGGSDGSHDGAPNAGDGSEAASKLARTGDPSPNPAAPTALGLAALSAAAAVLGRYHANREDDDALVL